ncbi:MAG: Rnf-Nqr domain containing protein, partial [Bacteroidales bacterium]
LGMGLGFSFALVILGACREFFGAGTIWSHALLPESTNMLLFILPPGAFITLGYLILMVNKLRKQK